MRYFRLFCKNLKITGDPPLLSNLKALFDELQFLYVDPDLSRVEVEAITLALKQGKTIAGAGLPASATAPDLKAPGLARSFHFVVLSVGVSTLDHPKANQERSTDQSIMAKDVSATETLAQRLLSKYLGVQGRTAFTAVYRCTQPKDTCEEIKTSTHDQSAPVSIQERSSIDPDGCCSHDQPADVCASGLRDWLRF